MEHAIGRLALSTGGWTAPGAWGFQNGILDAELLACFKDG